MNELPKQNLTKLANRHAVIKHLEKNCPGFNEDRVFISHKYEGKFQMVVANGATLQVEEFWDGKWALDMLIPRLEAYLQSGQWDKDRYYQPYTTPKGASVFNIPSPMIAFGPILRFPHHINDGGVIDKFRKLHTEDIGFREVPPTANAVYFTGN